FPSCPKRFKATRTARRARARHRSQCVSPRRGGGVGFHAPAGPRAGARPWTLPHPSGTIKPTLDRRLLREGKIMLPPPDPAPTPPAADQDGPPEADLPSQAGRYRLDGEIARGGMGIVLSAHDPDLGRTLAVKVLLGRHKDDPVMARRFLEEAQVCGQL